MKVPQIKTGMTEQFAVSVQKLKGMPSIQNSGSDANLIQEMLDFFAKARQNEILRQNEKILEDMKNPASKLNFNI